MATLGELDGDPEIAAATERSPSGDAGAATAAVAPAEGSEALKGRTQPGGGQAEAGGDGVSMQSGGGDGPRAGLIEEDDDEEGYGIEGVGGTSLSKEFRRRRLTFATQGKMSSNVSPPEAPAMLIYRALELGEQNTQQSPPFPASVLGIYSCHGAEPGWDEGEENLAKINQDRACIVRPFLGSDSCALLCVYDGHGERGDMVSNFVMNELPVRLAKHPKIREDPTLALEETFVGVDRALIEVATDHEQVYSGTTAVVALYRDGRVWVANAGDSRAVLATTEEGEGGVRGTGSGERGSSGLVPVALSEDHNPDRPGELERIEASGGFVSPPPEQGLSARVWLDQEMTRIGLAMARSIGDHAVKEAGVIATPEVFVRNLVDGDAFLVLASDGVWEFMNNKEVVDLVQECLQRGGGSEAAEACAELINESASRWRQNEGAYRDDISCIVLRLPCFDAVVSASSGNPRAGETAAASGSAGASAVAPASSGDAGDTSPA